MTATSLEDSKSFINELFKEDHVGDVDDGVYYFETDFLALKGNRDYLKLIKTLAILDAQRIKVSKDIENLEELKLKVDFDPESVKQEILEGKAGFLHQIKVEKVPDIDWTKYKMIDFQRKAPLKTRRMSKQPKDESFFSGDGNKQDSDKTIRVRGRVFNEKKPETFNQLWTVEEQLRLEQLLIEFPPEPVENRRWKKIADALGNRTTKQVCSRVQKYFQKLQKAGLTVPGRSPPKAIRAAHVHKKHKHLLYKPTTFFPGVAMAELESESEEENSIKEADEADLSHWKGILEKIVDEKNQKKAGEEMVVHYGYKCNFCGESPIEGSRWDCCNCTEFYSCSDCLASIIDTQPPGHPLTHKFHPISEFINPYYTSRALGSDNYLDPNFEGAGAR